MGVFSLDFAGRDNAEVAYQLEADYGILTRCGLHCAPAAHKTLGTFPRGTVRFSTGWFTSEADIDRRPCRHPGRYRRMIRLPPSVSGRTTPTRWALGTAPCKSR